MNLKSSKKSKHSKLAKLKTSFEMHRALISQKCQNIPGPRILGSPHEGEAMNVEEAGALIDYREPCEHGSNLPGHNSGMYGNGCNGSSYYDRPVNVDAGGQQDENERGEGYNDYILPLMVWLLVVTFVYARRTTRLLGRRFASVHKARRRTAVSICDRRSVNLRTGQWFGWLVAVIFYGLFALRLCCLDTTPWKHNEQLLLIDLCADFGGITVFRTKVK